MKTQKGLKSHRGSHVRNHHIRMKAQAWDYLDYPEIRLSVCTELFPELKRSSRNFCDNRIILCGINESGNAQELNTDVTRKNEDAFWETHFYHHK